MTALGANVKLVPGSEVYTQTLEDDILEVDYELPLDYHEDEVPALGDSYPGQTAPWDYIVVQTGSFTSRSGPARGAYLTGVKYARAKTPYDSGIDGLREMHRRFETGRLGRYMGTRIFLAADADAENIVAAALPEGTRMTTNNAWAAALLREKQIEKRWRVGLTKITAVYDTYTEWGGGGEVLHPGKGILEYDATATRMWNLNKQDVAGHIIGVPFKDDDHEWNRWVVIKGSNAWPLVTAQLRIRVLLGESGHNALAPLTGKVNSGACPKIIRAGAHTLWFNKLYSRQRPGGGNLYECAIYLKYDPEGWDTESEAQLQKFQVDEVPVLEDGVDNGQKQRVGDWLPVANTATVPFKGWKEASFAVINGYLA